MTINLMYYDGEVAVVTKQPQSIAELEGTVRTADTANVIDPVFVVEINSDDVDVAYINYAYIPEYHRYYFVRGKTPVRNKLWMLTMHVDVLMSFDAHIRSQYAMIARTSTATPMLTDNRVDYYADPYVNVMTFPSSLPTPTYVLAMIGRDATST